MRHGTPGSILDKTDVPFEALKIPEVLLLLIL